ncbi:MAG: hypothetical protein H7259_09595 [Cytophagales bacterium]|nr:hypothetical protein [Cytophaga sp.]
MRGLLITIGLVSSVFLALAVIEHYGRFNSNGRLIFLVLFSSSILYTCIYWIVIPAFKLFNNEKELSDEEASRQIGSYFPEIKDKLTNTLQLNNINSSNNALILASIQQKTKELNSYSFSGAINLSENRRYLRYVIPPILLIVSLLIIIPGLITESAGRIIKYNTHFPIPAPFQFNILNKNLVAFKNQDLEIAVELKGKELPDQCFIVLRNQRFKLKKSAEGFFIYSFKNVQRAEEFFFEAAGFESIVYALDVKVKPDIRALNIIVQYPAYLKKPQESIRNAGNLTLPEGTVATWNIETINAAELLFQFESEKGVWHKGLQEKDLFNFKKSIRKDERYSILVKSTDSGQLEPIQYTLHVIKDQFPTISVEEFRDSVLMEQVQFGGSLSDDYGISKLAIHYTIQKGKKQIKKGIKSVPLESHASNQTFYYTWGLDSVKIEPGEELEYYFEVFDNDGVNGAKSTKSNLFTWKIPTEEELEEELKTSSTSATEQFQEAVKEAAAIQKEMQQLEERLKSKKQLSWQDKKAMEDLVKKHDALEKELLQLKENLEKLQNKQNKFDPASKELAEKMKQLQKLMDELLDDDTKKMMEELEKLLQQNASKEDLEKAINKINDQDKTLEKELERNLEVFKQLQFDRALENNIQKLEELSKKQEELSEKTLAQKTPKEELIKEQQEMNKELEEHKEEMKNLEKLNEDLENKNPMEDLKQEEQEIEQEMQNSSKQLENNQMKKAGAAQKSAADKMKLAADKMQQMQQSMEAEQASENLQELRQILDNLLHLSFAQEALMKEFRKVQQSDPRYIALGQQQLKLKDDSRIIRDSLYALAKRVPQIEAFVTKEVVAMNKYMDGAALHIRERRPDLATADEQYAMTSMNNLALMLNEVLKQMQEQMAMSMPKSGSGQCSKPKPGQGQPKPKPGKGKGNMSDMQQQLNDQIEQLKKSGKTGRGLSEELAKLAAQQEMLRKSLQEMEKMMQEQGQQSGNEMKKLNDMMEQTEKDLVNKNLTNETLMRQREIETRLLEAEKSMRERDWDDTRESKTANQKPAPYPPSLEKYLKAKERQMELIKTIPPSYTPYYKEEIDEYFKVLD